MNTADFATKGDIAEVKALMTELTEKVETSLLTEFHKYAQATERRMFATETLTHTLSVAAIETRIREWESKR